MQKPFLSSPATFALTAVALAASGCVAQPFESGEAAVETCAEPEPSPRVLTLLLTMSSIRSADAPQDLTRADSMSAELIRGAVRWVSRVAHPKVLVVRDDNHNGEDADDPIAIGQDLESHPQWREQARIRRIIEEDGGCVSLLEEPTDGLRLADVRGYDVVWFSNPGHPLDDGLTVTTLQAFSELRGGVVLQGDDMAVPGAAPLTHLNGIANGHFFCGHATDNNVSDSYRVTLESSAAAMLGVSFREFLYGNDIDTSTARGEGETVFASATLNGTSGECPYTPAIVAWGAPPPAAQ